MGFRDEFRCSSFGFEGVERAALYKAYINVPRWFRLSSLGVTCVYTVAMMIASIVITTMEVHHSGWFHFMTSWNYMVNVTYFIIAFVKHLQYQSDADEGYEVIRDEAVGLMAGDESKHEVFMEKGVVLSDPLVLDTIPSKMSMSDKVYWFFHSLAFLMSSVVVVVYWPILFDPSSFETDFHWFQTIDRHGIVYLLFIFQYIFNKIPIRIFHCVYAIAVALIFFIHTYIYYLATSRLVYSIFDWGNAPLKAFYYFLGIVGLAIILQFILYGIDRFKHWLGNRK